MAGGKVRPANCILRATAGEKASYSAIRHHFYPVLHPPGLPIPAPSLTCGKYCPERYARARMRAHMV